MTIHYQTLVETTPSYAAETKGAYVTLTERHLQALWLEQKYLKPLIASGGEIIQVLSPGLWNTEAGPDFLKAHLFIGEREIKGDIEIHLNDANWTDHRHQEDQNYDSVVLHVSYWQPKFLKPIIKKNGESVISVHLDGQLTIPLAKVVQLIDLDLYPYQRFAGTGQCAQSLYHKLPEEQIVDLFNSAAYWRCEKKVDYLHARFSDRSLQLVAGMAMALGYKHNAEAFIELFSALLPYRDLPEEELLSMAMGCCGFFESDFKKEWEKSHYFLYLRTLWWGNKDKIDHQAHLRLDHIRPLNHPVRRLAYLVKLLQDNVMDDLWYEVIRIWQVYASSNHSAKAIREVKQSFQDLIPNYEDLYWKTHFLFEVPIKPYALSLIGKDQKTEIIINVMIPLIYMMVKESGGATGWNAFQSFYNSFKAVPTSKSRYLQLRFFGNSPKSHLISSAPLTQGVYQLHKDFCVHFEASCEGCPFVRRYQEGNSS